MYKEMSLRERRHNPRQYGKKVSKEQCLRHKRRPMTEDKPGEVKQWTRYNVVQYLCSFPKLDPDEMAAALMREGIEIRFDDSSISVADNAKHQRRVMRIVRAMERLSEDNRRVTGGNTR